MASYSYCYSEVSYGVTNNAASNGLSWDMGTVLPDTSLPGMSLEINGLTYSYTMNKNLEDDAKVHIRNENAIGSGYIFEETDDWSGKNGTNIQKYFRLPYINSSYWGKGEMALEGKGEITNPYVVYNYRLTVEESKFNCTTSPLLDPSCPGYQDALLKYLANLETEPDINDPFYDEWVQSQLDNKTEIEEAEENKPKEEKEEKDLEKDLGSNTIDSIIDASQQEAVMAALSAIPKIESYYEVIILGGEYQETLKLEDKEIPDNRRALRNLASDSNHRTMVRSQYDRN